MSTKSVEVAEPTSVPETVKVRIRDVAYTFRELEISEYNKLVKAASHEEADADGIMQDVTDNGMLMMLMIRKCCIDPLLTPEQVAAIPTRAHRAISKVINDLHFATEPIVQIKDGEPDEASKETPKGNDA